jgi:hypothetical protein
MACHVVAAPVLEGEFDLYWLSVNENARSFLAPAILAMRGLPLAEGLYSQPRPSSRIAFLFSLV